MTGFYRSSAALLLAAMLAGCGAHGLTPPAAQMKSLAAQAVMAVDPNVEKMIADFKAIQGYDDGAMAKRLNLVASLGDSDSDLAMQFLQDQYNHLTDYPANVRDGFEAKLGDALEALDTYDQELDEKAIAAGPGTSLMQTEAYYDAMTRQKRHKGFLSWVSNGWKRFWAGLTGKKSPKKRHRRPSPSPNNPSPSYPSDPSGGNSFGNYPGY